MKKFPSAAFISLAALAVSPFIALPAQAVCPVCVVAVGAGLGLSEYLGIDDTIAGLWIGGLLVALTVWTINWFNKKNWLADKKPLRQVRDILTAILYYAMVIGPLAIKGIIGNPFNRFWGIDKLILGITVGSAGFLSATLWYNRIKKRRGRAHFPFEKVAMPVGALAILSLIFYFLVR